jgi:hypothetical protein
MAPGRAAVGDYLSRLGTETDAAWAQAIGSVAAIASGFLIAIWQYGRVRKDAADLAKQNDAAAQHHAKVLADMAVDRCQQTIMDLKSPEKQNGVGIQQIKQAVINHHRLLEGFPLASLKGTDPIQAFACLAPLLAGVIDELTVLTDACLHNGAPSTTLLEEKIQGINKLMVEAAGYRDQLVGYSSSGTRARA